MRTIKALTFDTGGTILDWHTGVSRALSAAGERRGLERDWPMIANNYRARSLKAMVNTGADAPATFNIDDVHRRVLDEMIVKHDLGAFTADDREAIWRAWHNRLLVTVDDFEKWSAQTRIRALRHQVQVHFVIEKNGDVSAIRVELESGCQPFDDAATDALAEVILRVSRATHVRIVS